MQFAQCVRVCSNLKRGYVVITGKRKMFDERRSRINNLCLAYFTRPITQLVKRFFQIY